MGQLSWGAIIRRAIVRGAIIRGGQLSGVAIIQGAIVLFPSNLCQSFHDRNTETSRIRKDKGKQFAFNELKVALQLY